MERNIVLVGEYSLVQEEETVKENKNKNNMRSQKIEKGFKNKRKMKRGKQNEKSQVEG